MKVNYTFCMIDHIQGIGYMHLDNIKRKERIQNCFSKPKEVRLEGNDRNIKGTIPQTVI